ncbi:hypothetical protein MPH_05290 [Macrophomina phaseolina MS6]|uniref:Transcription factor fungi n=1 Tax=Macrophomina phaseolina (strain MS6) TaxID=1126212 RepID=K2RXQ9_MACPH|nr:hypothetical protein MPH_05290 [Macrophomina phaseolina MS6]
MLAAASGSRTLNGHGLYDEEFRKMLAVRYVMAGERSLELLQGLIIYCAWYPVHLRPKDKRVSQYIRIAVDIVSDLELDNAADGPLPSPQSSGLDKLRTLLATYLLVSTHAISRNQATTLPFSSWISKCCDTLSQQHSLSQDKALVSLVRMQHIIEQPPVTPAETEICLRQVEADMGPEITSMPSTDTALLFTRIVTLASPLLTTFQRKPSSRATACSPLLTAAQLASCIPFARAFFAAILALPRAHLTCFSSLDWARFVLCVVLCFRLSFPLTHCPEWDVDAARRELRFEQLLAQMCELGGREGKERNADAAGGFEGNPPNVVAAMQVMLRLVKRKFDAKIEAEKVGAATEAPAARATSGCPMINGSAEQWLMLWDEEGAGTGAAFSSDLREADSVMSGPRGREASYSVWGTATPPVYHDLWATMTMHWGPGGGRELGARGLDSE